jgi:tricarballylate dehydrogenase
VLSRTGTGPSLRGITEPRATGQIRAGLGPAWAEPTWDVVVIGGGNAALVSALTASDLGARVLLLERAPHHLRGGNTRHTRNIRCIHEEDSYNSGAYRHDEFWNDLCGVGSGPSNEALARATVEASADVLEWMSAKGIRWQMPLAGTLHLTRTNRFFLGGGKTLANTYYRVIGRRPTIEVAYEAMVEDFEFDGPACRALTVSFGGIRHRVRCRAVICASGGFESNIDWLRRYWGDAADNYIIRGTPYNDGQVLARLHAAGAAAAGQEKGFHAIAVDARSPRFDGGIVTRLDNIPFGIVVNRDGVRFYDEGEDLWPKRYATWGRHIAEQPGQIAYCLWDSKVTSLCLPPVFPATTAPTVADLATSLGLDPRTVGRTVTDFNNAIVPGGSFDPAILDDCHTSALVPAKTHWAQALDTPPYFAIAVRPGITFTYLGVAVDADARVLRSDGSGFTNVFAAGEIMSGNILSSGYLAGFGMTIGSVWGRKAGRSGARCAR